MFPSSLWKRKGPRWHVCRANFARSAFIELRVFLRKMLRKCSPIFLSLFQRSQTIHDNPICLNFPFFSFKNQIFHWWSSWSPPSRTVCTVCRLCKHLSYSCKIYLVCVCIPNQNPFMAIHACLACCVALSASVLWPLRPVASVLTHNTSASALMEGLGGNQQQQLTCMVAFSALRLVVLGEWLWVWEGTKGRKTNPVPGDGFLGNARTPKKQKKRKMRKPPKKRKKKKQTEKRKKRKKRKIRKVRKGAENHQICFFFPAFGCWKGIAKRLGGLMTKTILRKQCGNYAEAETMRKLCRGAALERGSLPT